MAGQYGYVPLGRHLVSSADVSFFSLLSLAALLSVMYFYDALFPHFATIQQINK